MTALLLLPAVLIPLGCKADTKEPPPAAEPASVDRRTAVPLPAEGQQAVLGEMRRMLGAMGGAMAAAAAGDTAALLAAVGSVGTAAAADPALEALLPTPWKDLAERTHGEFDSIGAVVRRTAGPSVKDTLLVRLGRLTGACGSCHETYRLTVR